jgi:group II intron reverse transcriptase/maturase
MRLLPREIQIAWKSVRHGGKSAGPDGWDAWAFSQVAAPQLEQLAAELASGGYLHGPYRQVRVPKPDGGLRLLALANIRDRIAQRLLLERLTPLLEQHALPCSYAYRPGRGVKQALAAVAEYRDRGFDQVLRTDVENCFDSIRLALVEEQLAALNVPREILQLVLEAIAAAGLEGLPQGAVLSPALCNLALTPLDQVLSAKHLRVVRYADDLIILAQSQRRLAEAQHRAAYTLWQLGLKLNARKTQMTSFEEGFRFLGARFVGNFMFVDKPVRYPRRPSGPPTRRRGDGLGYLV